MIHFGWDLEPDREGLGFIFEIAAKNGGSESSHLGVWESWVNLYCQYPRSGASFWRLTFQEKQICKPAMMNYLYPNTAMLLEQLTIQPHS